jgi:hypothetical protein
MVIRDLEYLETVSESKEASGIVGGAKAWFKSSSFVLPFLAANKTSAFAQGKISASAAGLSGATILFGPLGLVSGAGGIGAAFAF